MHLYCLAIFYVYRDTIAAPGPVSLLSYVEKLITAGTREGMSYGDTKSHATKVNLRTGTLSKNKNTVSTAGVHAPIITTKMTVVQTLQTADLVLLISLGHMTKKIFTKICPKRCSRNLRSLGGLR